MKNHLSFDTNNDRVLNFDQYDHDDRVFVATVNANGSYHGKTYVIPNTEFVMLFNLYRYIKDNDIKNDFINPNGKNTEEGV